MATRSAQKVTANVPAISGRTPNDDGSKSGAQFVPVKNSTGLTSRKNSIAGRSSESTIPTVVASETNAARPRTILIRSSPSRRLEGLRSISAAGAAGSVASVVVTTAPPYPVAPSSFARLSSSCCWLSGTN